MLSNCVPCVNSVRGLALPWSHPAPRMREFILAMRAVPMAVIAHQLGHSDTRMTERHYAHLAPNYVAEKIRESFPRLTDIEAPTVMRIERFRSKMGRA